jgi:hypothetical protein
MSKRTPCIQRCSSLLMLENALLRSITLQVNSLARERLAFIVAHSSTFLQQPALIVAHACNSLFTHRSSRLLSLASVLRSPRSSSRTSCVRLAFIAAHRCSCYRERFACVTLKTQVCSLARECLAFIAAHACNSLARALIVALACNSHVHTHRPSSSLILYSFQASCVHPRLS